MSSAPLPSSDNVATDTTGSITKLAILAVGGQGGGVLTNWVEQVALAGGYLVQATSVAGVAQRTGSTIYYIEMAPKPENGNKRQPVFALAPAPGDVDILVAAELMEAGRAVMRGFVTPDRTTLIASTHRVLATIEKIVPGDGRSDAAPVIEELHRASHRAVCLDLEAIAVDAGSVISASLLGALAGSGCLPFPRSLYEDTIRESGRGVEASLTAFDAAFDGAVPRDDVDGGRRQSDAPLPTTGAPTSLSSQKVNCSLVGPEKLSHAWDILSVRCEGLPPAVRAIAQHGLRKVVDYQDVDYGRDYLDRVERSVDDDNAARDFEYARTLAKYLANAVCYDDLIRVADLKTRASRDFRLRREQGLGDEDVVEVTEYFHPRAQEVCGTLPARLGRWIESNDRRFALLDRLVNRGRRVRTDTLRGFLMLWIIGAMKPYRRSLLRHACEHKHIQSWLEHAENARKEDYHLGVEVLKCRRLIKGYSDTHARGLSKYDRVLSALPLVSGRDDAADWIRRLRDVALKDEQGDALDGALKTVASL